jgi:hypothetical protein
MVVQASKDLVIAVRNHDDTQREAHQKQSKRLQAIEIAHISSR